MMLGGRNCAGLLAPDYLSFVSAFVSFGFFLVTVAGNLFVLLAMYKDPNRELRTPFNYFVVNLAFADIIVGLVTEPISVALHLKEGLTDEPLSDSLYGAIHMSYFISCTASVLSLAALTVDRYVAITSPYYYEANQNVNNVLVTSLIIWVVSISLSFVYFKVGYISYAFVFVNSAVILTLLILIVSYVQIYRKIKHQFQVPVCLHEGRHDCSKRKFHEDEVRVAKVFLLVLLAFLLCYIPSCVMIYVSNFCDACSCYSIHWIRDMQILFVLLNSCLNPFLYAWRLTSFRKAFSSIIYRTPRFKETLSASGNGNSFRKRRDEFNGACSREGSSRSHVKASKETTDPERIRHLGN